MHRMNRMGRRAGARQLGIRNWGEGEELGKEIRIRITIKIMIMGM